VSTSSSEAIVNNRNTLFAKKVNSIAESWIQPEIELWRQKLIREGKYSQQEIEKWLVETRIEMQKQYLPIIKKELEDTIRANRAESRRP
jgi:hypothetical protein